MGSTVMPGGSLSVIVTGSAVSTLEYSASPPEWVRDTLSATPSSSCPAAIDTVWGLFQLIGVKVRASLVSLAPPRVNSEPLWPLTVTVTFTVGSVARATV